MDQQQISANILAYSPSFKIDKNIELINNELKQEEITETISNSYKTGVLESFESYLPSSQITDMMELINRIDITLNTMEEDLSGNSYAQKYLSATTDEERNKIKEENFNDIYGSSMLESYIEVKEIYKEVSEIKELFSLAMYGKEVDDVVSKEIDEASVDKLSMYEREGEFEKVNYFSLSYDTQVCFILEEYCFKIDGIVRDFSAIEDTSRPTTVNEATISMLEKKFEKNNSLMKKDLFKETYTKSNIINSLYNLFLSKQDLNMFMDTLSSLFMVGEEYEIFEEMRQDNFDDIDNSVDEFLKSILFSTLSKEDISKTIENKAKIRGFFVE